MWQVHLHLLVVLVVSRVVARGQRWLQLLVRLEVVVVVQHQLVVVVQALLLRPFLLSRLLV